MAADKWYAFCVALEHFSSSCRDEADDDDDDDDDDSVMAIGVTGQRSAAKITRRGPPRIPALIVHKYPLGSAANTIAVNRIPGSARITLQYDLKMGTGPLPLPQMYDGTHRRGTTTEIPNN